MKIVIGLTLFLCICCVRNDVKQLDLKNDARGTFKSSPKDFKTQDFRELERLITMHPAEVLVVNFWATWCAPCIKELPVFEKLRSNYKDQGVSILLVSLDFPTQTDRLKEFIYERNVQSEVVLLNDPAENEWIPKVSADWSGAIPATWIITKSNRTFFERSFTYPELEIVLNKIMIENK